MLTLGTTLLTLNMKMVLVQSATKSYVAQSSLLGLKVLVSPVFLWVNFVYLLNMMLITESFYILTSLGYSSDKCPAKIWA